jgi:hypothetical protein
MAERDDQVAALRAFLALEPHEAERLTKQLVETDRAEGYGELIYAAFVIAVRRRFSPTWTIHDIIRFVATARARLLDDEIAIDPRTAEILLRRALGESIATELDEEARARAQIFLLGELVVDEEFDDGELGEFLSQACALADRFVA